MDNKCMISINQLADFCKGTESKKRNIVKQQKNPNTFKMAYYQLAKARIKKTLELKGKITPILSGIDELKNRKPVKKRQISDKQVSIEAMHRFISIKLPKLLTDTEYEVFKPTKSKSLLINGVEIIISPDLIIRGKINGITFLGGFKVHISKSNIFDIDQQNIVASSIFKYLETVIAEKDEIVLPELCLSLDVFGSGFVPTSSNLENTLENIETVCEEIKVYWNAS